MHWWGLQCPSPGQIRPSRWANTASPESPGAADWARDAPPQPICGATGLRKPGDPLARTPIKATAARRAHSGGVGGQGRPIAGKAGGGECCQNNRFGRNSDTLAVIPPHHCAGQRGGRCCLVVRDGPPPPAPTPRARSHTDAHTSP